MGADENLILDELSKKKVSIWKRIAIFFIDSALLLGTFFGLFYTVGTATIQGIAQGPIAQINEIYKTECNNRKVPYKSGTYGIYTLDREAYIDQIIDKCKDYNEAVEKYEEMYTTIDESIRSYRDYSSAYNGFASTYYGTLIASMLIPSFIYMFLIPVLNKKKKTIAMFITKTSLAKDKTNIICSNLRVLARFFSIFAIEIALIYVIAQYLGFMFVAIGNIILICFTKKRQGLHDLLTQCHVEKDEFTYTE